ncbi:MAG: hypothetical protein PHY74_06890 [Candidatus Bathyarchaeota archaeon]|nr:hypothetical protein [Candidatus Bathyarchaeota archaeon]
MARMGKYFSLFLVVILALCSLIMVESAFAQTIPTPAVPEFTVKFVNASYSITNTNPYTGLNELQLVDNNTVEIKINNQPWQHSTYQIYYNIRVKPSFGGDWTELYPLRNQTSSYTNGVFTYANYIIPEAPIMPNSGQIVINFPVTPTEYYGESGYDIKRYYFGDGTQEGHYFAFLHGIPYGGQLDFQVQALVGHNDTYWYVMHPLWPQYGGYYQSATAYDKASSWSNTQTIIIGQTPSITSPTPTESVPSSASDNLSDDLIVTLALIAVAFSVVAVISLLIYVRHLKRHISKN